MKAALIHAALVGIGGFTGALARFGLTSLIHRTGETGGFPFGTLVVNLLGCFLIGVVAGLVAARGMFSPEFRIFALVGVLGGFTTFSTFGYESFVLIRDAEYLRAGLNVGGHVIAGIVLVWLGYAIATTGGNGV